VQTESEAESGGVLLTPGRVALVLAAGAALLVGAAIGIQIVSAITGHHRMVFLVKLFYLDAEQNLPTLYSTCLLLLAAQTLGVVALLKRRQRAQFAAHWAILAAGFLVMAVDEACSLHELLVRPMRALLGGGHLGIFTFAWVIPGSALVAVLGLFFLPFLLRLPARTRLASLVAAAVYLGGAIGFELAGGFVADAQGKQNLLYRVVSTAEETLEMAGVIVFIWAVLDYAASEYGELLVRFVPAGVTAKPDRF
jgi:hypothetical protein